MSLNFNLLNLPPFREEKDLTDFLTPREGSTGPMRGDIDSDTSGYVRVQEVYSIKGEV